MLDLRWPDDRAVQPSDVYAAELSLFLIDEIFFPSSEISIETEPLLSEYEN